MKNYYEVLEVDKNASLKVIKGVYKLHIKEKHPDLFQGEERVKAEEKIKELNEAYEVLSDASKRRDYDKMLLQEYEDKLITLKKENERLKKAIVEEMYENDTEDVKNIDSVDTSGAEEYIEYEPDENVTLENNQKYMLKLQKKELLLKAAATLCVIIAASIGIYKATGYNLLNAVWNAIVKTFT